MLFRSLVSGPHASSGPLLTFEGASEQCEMERTCENAVPTVKIEGRPNRKLLPLDFLECCFRRSVDNDTFCKVLVANDKDAIRDHCELHAKNGTLPKTILDCPFPQLNGIKCVEINSTGERTPILAFARHLSSVHLSQ